MVLNAVSTGGAAVAGPQGALAAAPEHHGTHQQCTYFFWEYISLLPMSLFCAQQDSWAHHALQIVSCYNTRDMQVVCSECVAVHHALMLKKYHVQECPLF
jgi:hypothetical protein